jgi:predicted DNA-binding protein YlxM (UPF0122 family)
MTFLKPVRDKDLSLAERKKLIIEDRETHSLEETAKEFGYTRQRIHQICNPKPDKPKKKRGRKRIFFSQTKINKIIKMYHADEMSIKDVAAKMKVSNKVIENVLRKNQIIIRQPNDWKLKEK